MTRRDKETDREGHAEKTVGSYAGHSNRAITVSTRKKLGGSNQNIGGVRIGDN